MTSKLQSVLNFLHTAEKLKSVLRHSWLSTNRRESVAEHTWRTCLMALILHDLIDQELDLKKVLSMLIVHDLGEINTGDHFAWKGKLKNKHQSEKKELKKIISLLSPQKQIELLNLWQEFDDRKTKEAKFAQALDKLEVVIQHNEAPLSTWNQKEYSFNLTYGTTQPSYHPILSAFRKLIKTESETKIATSQKKSVSIILGIDPGYDRLGWAIGQADPQSLTNLKFGCIKTDKKLPLTQRYQQLIEELSDLIVQHQPTEVAIEDLFFSKNTKTALKVSETRGMIIGLCLQNKIQVFEYKPNQIKLAVTGHGHATKQAVDKMVRLHLKLPSEKIIDDTIDALATLITHQASRKLFQKGVY